MKHWLPLCLALAVPLAQAQPPKDLPVDELKRVYLSCSDAALDRRLGNGGIQYCSMIYEELKRRAFDGDFERLLAWSRAQPDAQRTAR
jgi:hypothetical protein